MNCRLRRATEEDCELLFQWANDPLVRRNSFSGAEILWEEHQAWFHALLNRPDCGQYIYMCDDQPVGQARVTVSDREAEVGYSICAQKRGMGHGKRMLQQLKDAVREEFPRVKVLVARVKSENIASQKAFESIGYRETYRTYMLEVDDESTIF